MTPETRTRRRYDHRLRGLVHSSGNIGLAIQNGVPRSTAKDWLRRPTPDVVTLDVATMTEEILRQEVVALRKRNDRLIAILRLLVVLLRISGFTLARCRVADGSKKALLLLIPSLHRDWNLLPVFPLRLSAEVFLTTFGTFEDGTPPLPFVDIRSKR